METTTQSVAANPLAAAITAQVQTSLVEMKPIKFNFRTTELDEKDEAGKPKEWKRPTFIANLPLLTKAGLIVALEAGDKSTELALEAVNQVIIDQARGVIGDAIEANAKIELTQDVFVMDKLGFLAIAMLPKSERGSGIPKEQWAAFVTSYKKVMASQEAIALFPDKKARTPEVLEKHGILLGGKFNQVRSRKDVVGQMLGFLDIYVQVVPEAEGTDENIACYDFLKQKGQTILQGESFEDL